MAQKVVSLAGSALADASSRDRYISFTDPRVEPKVPDEDAMTEELIDIVHRVLERHFSSHRHGLRATHVKTQAILKGTLTIPADLPAHLSQGLFAGNQVQEHPVALRFANEPIFIQDDRTPGPRGVGMKIFNVNGEFMDPIDRKTHTQDMTFNNAPMLELTDLPTTLEIFKLREQYYDDQESLTKALKKRSDASKQLAPTQLPNQHFLSYTMYSQSAYRFGDYVAKYALFPTTQVQGSLATNAQITNSSDPDQHSQWLREYFQTHDAEYDLRVQLLVSPYNQPVEDTSTPWDETAFPYETVGHVIIPKGQDPFEPARRTFWDDRVKLNVWYGLEAHRPLGSVNRLRKELYKTSSRTRGELNAVEVGDIDSIEQIP